MSGALSEDFAQSNLSPSIPSSSFDIPNALFPNHGNEQVPLLSPSLGPPRGASRTKGSGRVPVLHSDGTLHNHLCPLCPKTFQSRADVVRHMRTHTGERPYKCPHCPYSAALKGNLKSHIISRHSEFSRGHPTLPR